MIEIVLIGAVRKSLGMDENQYELDTDGPISVREALSCTGLDLEKLNPDRILVLQEGTSCSLSRALDTIMLRSGEKITLINMIQGG